MRFRPFPVVFLFVLGLTGSLAVRLAADGVAYRVADLRTAPGGTGYFNSWGFTPVATGFLLPAFIPGIGTEPWFTTGAAGDMSLIRNIGPGEWGAYGETLGTLGTLVLFSAWEPASGYELWRTNGTPAGTWRISEIVPGPGSAIFYTLGKLGGILLLGINDIAHGRELWRTDGTAAGTWLVADIASGPESGICGYRRPGADLGGKLLFCGWDPGHGPELWATDGTAGGTTRLTDVVADSGGLSPESFARGADRVYFVGTDALHGRELWASDGTPQGTGLVADLRPGPNSSNPAPWADGGGRFVFTAYSPTAFAHHLWSTDGTAAGTVRLADADVEWEWVNIGGGGRIGDRIVFAALDALGREPWVTDGTSAGTHVLADLAPGSSSSLGGWGAVNGHDGLYFCASDAAYDTFLWRTDGTTAGTAAIAPLPECEDFPHGAASGGTTLFELHWWTVCQPHDDCEYSVLWRTDGTAAGTVPFLADPPEVSASNPERLVARDGGVVFRATTGLEPVPYSRWVFGSDGTEAGTLELTTTTGESVSHYSGSAPSPDGEVVLVGESFGDGWSALWHTEGDHVDLLGAGGAPFWTPSEPTRVGDAVYFAAYGESSNQLWRTDGTVGGTWRVDGEPSGFLELGRLTDVFERLWFEGDTAALGAELWESGGTAPTTLPHDLTPGPDPTSPSRITPLDPATGSLVYLDDRVYGGMSLYSFTPGAADEVFLHTFSSAVPGTSEVTLATLDGELYFFDFGAAGTRFLWRSDGTAAGTQPVTAVGPDGSYSSRESAPELVAFQGKLFFQACFPAVGCEPWTSDGTAGGTRLFADLEPGPASFLPTALTPIGDRLYLSGCRAARGCEPWVSDGTPAGTHRAGDAAPGIAGSGAHGFTRSGNLVYFAADDSTGTELWAMPIEIFFDGFETGDVTRWSGVGEP